MSIPLGLFPGPSGSSLNSLDWSSPVPRFQSFCENKPHDYIDAICNATIEAKWRAKGKGKGKGANATVSYDGLVNVNSTQPHKYADGKE